jgi:hypothetical protein
VSDTFSNSAALRGAPTLRDAYRKPTHNLFEP